MVRFLTFWLACSFILPLSANLMAQGIFVRHREEGQTEHQEEEVRNLTFVPGNMLVTKFTGSKVYYPLAGLRYLSFTDYMHEFPVSEQPLRPLKMAVIPNPVSDIATIQLPSSVVQTATIEVFSIDGKLMLRQEVRPGTSTHQVNVQILPRGIYFCRVTSGKLTETTRFIRN